MAVGCLAVAASTIILPGVPSYDPWAWIVWGREVLAADLRTATGPSWKPLPILFTAPFSLFGEAAPELWLVVAVVSHRVRAVAVQVGQAGVEGLPDLGH